MEQEVAFSAIMIFAIIVIVMYAVIFAIAIASYILQALGMYTIAKRRNISKPIFAWFPGTNIWLLGAIADDYDEKVKGVKKKSRVVLVSLYIAMLVLAVITVIAVVLLEVTLLAGGEVNSTAIVFIVVVAILYIGVFAIAIVATVFMYIAYYKLFKSCNPDNAVVFLVLSILFSISLPVLIFVSRKKDDGLLKDDAVVA